jgi:hypothetical protein
MVDMITPEEFKVVGHMPLADIETGLRAAPLLHDRNSFPFANAHISFDRVTQEDILPTSLIAVRRKLERQGVISAAIQACGLSDQYELDDGGVMLQGGPEGLKGMIPPVVVEAFDLSGTPQFGILDGIHRALDCFVVQGRKELLVARITNADPDWKAYAYTNPWEEVAVVDEKPGTKREWKHYVGNPDNNEEYGLYVDFGHLNGSRPYVPGEGEIS